MEWLLRTQGPLLIQLVGFVGVLSLVALAISHRVAGPLFSLEKSLQIVRSGNLVHRVRFRRRDELPYLRDAFNGMLDSIHAKVRRDRDSLARVRHEIDELLSKNIVDRETRSVLERLKIHLAQITREFTL
jgi:nitrogen fixation/metabolism regulation signal transduction histidine kinase